VAGDGPEAVPHLLLPACPAPWVQRYCRQAREEEWTLGGNNGAVNRLYQPSEAGRKSDRVRQRAYRRRRCRPSVAGQGSRSIIVSGVVSPTGSSLIK
jgi:hypothetical protein